MSILCRTCASNYVIWSIFIDFLILILFSKIFKCRFINLLHTLCKKYTKQSEVRLWRMNRVRFSVLVTESYENERGNVFLTSERLIFCEHTTSTIV